MVKQSLGHAVGVAAALFVVAGCSAAGLDETSSSEDVGSAQARVATYDLRSHVSDALRGDSRGWEVEWQIPVIANASADGTLGQWYWNLESGLYHTGDGWFVYYYGDDNGLTGADPLCDTQWLYGGICHGIYANLQPGQRVLFRYEYCTASHVASVTGSQLCLYVDLEDGNGLRFLSEDARTTDEMYTHDIENFDAVNRMGISCTSPSKMVKQRRKNSAGTWVNMTGADSWRFVTESTTDRFQNLQLAANPASWDSCSGTPATETCSDGIWNEGESGVDCGGPCAACATACLNQALTRVAAVSSSQENAGLGAALAIDGNTGTRWSSAFSDPQWIYVDLGSLQRVRRVLLNWETAASANYRIEIASSSMGPWTSIYSTTSGNGGIDDISGLSANGRYVRMYSQARTTGYGNSLWEFQVFGDPNPSCTP